MGVPCKSFTEMHLDKAKDILQMVNECIKTVRASAGAGAGNGNLTIESDPDGFPIVPSPPNWDKISKDDLERLYPTYLTQHYRPFISHMPVLN